MFVFDVCPVDLELFYFCNSLFVNLSVTESITELFMI